MMTARPDSLNSAVPATVKASRIIPVCRFNGGFSRHETIAPSSMKAAYEDSQEGWDPVERKRIVVPRLKPWNPKMPFQLNQFHAGGGLLKEVEACLDRIREGRSRLVKDQMVLTLPRPVLSKDESKEGRIDADELPVSLPVEVHLVATSEAISVVRNWLMDEADAALKAQVTGFRTAAFLQTWVGLNPHNRVRGNLMTMEMRGWMMLDHDAMYFIDKAMFNSMCALFER